MMAIESGINYSIFSNNNDTESAIARTFKKSNDRLTQRYFYLAFIPGRVSFLRKIGNYFPGEMQQLFQLAPNHEKKLLPLEPGDL